MGLLSKLFGATKPKNNLPEALAYVHRVLGDEKLQLELAHPSLHIILKSSPAYDRDPNGTGAFGFTETNPIPVNGPIGQLAYLSRLQTTSGERLLFHRLGALGQVDVFECVTFSAAKWYILYTDFYHPRPTRNAPEGFGITKEVAQFSGFHQHCADFPYDFEAKKACQQEAGLLLAYISIRQIQAQIEKRAFRRPSAHMASLELVQSRLSSSQT